MCSRAFRSTTPGVGRWLPGARAEAAFVCFSLRSVQPCTPRARGFNLYIINAGGRCNSCGRVLGAHGEQEYAFPHSSCCGGAPPSQSHPAPTHHPRGDNQTNKIAVLSPGRGRQSRSQFDRTKPRIHPSPATNTKCIILPTFHTTNECVLCTLLVCGHPPSALASAAKPSQVSAKPLAAAAQPSATRVSFTVPAWAAWSGLAPAA